MSKLPWVKAYLSWYTTDSHLRLGQIALNIGPRLMLFASRSPTRGEMRMPDGSPVTRDDIAAACRISKRKAACAMEELKAAGTIDTCEDGAWFFPEFDRWQASPSAARVRRHRERHKSVTVTPDVTKNVMGEERGKKKEVNTSPSEKSPASPDEVMWPSAAEVEDAWRTETGRRVIHDQQRTKAIRARAREHSELRDIRGWVSLFRRVAASPFLRGENDRGWAADLNWTLKRANCRKILEDNYSQTKQTKQGMTPSEAARLADEATERERPQPSLLALDGGAR